LLEAQWRHPPSVAFTPFAARGHLVLLLSFTITSSLPGRNCVRDGARAASCPPRTTHHSRGHEGSRRRAAFIIIEARSVEMEMEIRNKTQSTEKRECVVWLIMVVSRRLFLILVLVLMLCF
jgi:hypothetical protein